MKVYKYPSANSYSEILQRPALDYSALEEKITPILLDIKKNGDSALRKYTAEFDKVNLEKIEVSDHEKYFALNQVNTNVFDAIKLAAENMTLFHRKQLQTAEKIETMPGVICWRKNVGIEKVGLYIPGGTAPLFSTVLMLTIPAVLAGCREIVICTPDR